MNTKVLPSIFTPTQIVQIKAEFKQMLEQMILTNEEDFRRDFWYLVIEPGWFPADVEKKLASVRSVDADVFGDYENLQAEVAESMGLDLEWFTP